MTKKKNFITNINTFSALLDRLITEKIKEYFFTQNNQKKLINKQKVIISAINKEIIFTLLQIKKNRGYKYLKENRTFNYNSVLLVKLFSKLTNEDLNIGTADNQLAKSIKGKNDKEVIINLKKSRDSLENRAIIKNQIDESLSKIFKV